MHHDHLHEPERQPTTTSSLKHELDDLSAIKVAAKKLRIIHILLQAHNRKAMFLHNRITYRSDALKKVLSIFLIGTWKYFKLVSSP